MSRRIALAVFALVVVVASVAWFARRDGARGDATPGIASTPIADARVTDERELALVAPADVERADRDTSASHAESARVAAPAYPADALWVEGRVEFPPDVPLDERARVVARGRRFLGAEEHAFDVDADGRFRAAFAPHSTRGELAVVGRYLHSPEKSVDPRDAQAEIVLRPTLGGRLRVRVEPSALALRGPLDLTSASAWAMSGRLGSYRQPAGRASTPDASGLVEFDALSADAEWSISVEVRGFTLLPFEPIVVERGRTHDATAALIVAPRFAGTVRDASGAPVASAAITLEIDGAKRPVGVTRADGSFDVHADALGSTHVLVDARGNERVVLGPYELREGEGLTDMVVVVGATHVLTGRVLADDAPARGVDVRLYQGGETQITDVVTTGDDGAFRFASLADVEHVVAASVVRATDAPPWTARARVPAGTANVDLALHAGHALRGRVVDDAGVAVDSIAVEITPVVEDSAGRERRRATFESGGGLFVMHGVPTGAWTLEASRTSRGTPAELRVELPRDAERELVLVVDRLAALTGRVLDPAGVPVRGASLHVGRDWGARAGCSDANGVYRVDAAVAGASRVRAVHDDHAPSEWRDVQLAPGVTSALPDLVLRRGVTIVGTVRDLEDRPLASVEVTCGINDVPRVVSTAEDGSYRFDHVAPGPLELSVRDDRTIVFGSKRAVAVDGAMLRIDLGGRSANAIRVRGTVRAGVPVAGVEMSFAQNDAGVASGVARARTKNDGTFEVELPSTGWYVVGVFGRGMPHTMLAREITGSGAIVDIDLGAARIRGRVLGPDGRPLGGVDVRASKDQESELEPLQMQSGVESARDGSFEIGPLLPGTYRVTAGPSGAFAAAVVEGVVLARDDVSGVDLALARGGSLAVTVRGADGKPAAGARVHVVHEDGNSREVSTDASGSARFDGLALGEHVVSAMTDFAAQRESVAVTVVVDDTANATVALVAGGRVVLRALDSAGDEIDLDLVVETWIEDANGARIAAWHDVHEGAPMYGPLAPGTYAACAQLDGARVCTTVVVRAGERVEAVLRASD